MTDLEDYLLSGVMNGNPFALPVPFDPFELSIAALYVADDMIDEYRRKDRAFDAACDPAAHAWEWQPMPAEALRVGFVVNVPPASVGKSPTDGTILDLGEASNPYRWVRTTGGSFSWADWDDRARVRTPVPMDLATLGRYHATPTAGSA
jgi:hypothetical protein